MKPAFAHGIAAASVAAILVSTLICTAAAQHPAPGSQRSPGNHRRTPVNSGRQTWVGILSRKDVQKHLNMTPEQITGLDAKEKEYRISVTLAARAVRTGSFEERLKAQENVSKLHAKLAAEVLDEKQLKRYGEVELQYLSTRALLFDSVAQKLALTDEQKLQIRRAQEDNLNEAREAMRALDPLRATRLDRQAMADRTKASQQNMQKRIDSVLTDEQKQIWKEMQGEPFTFASPVPR